MKFREQLILRAKEAQLSPQRFMQHYAMERFLYRLSLSPYAEKLFLKGGMLLAGLGSAQARTTMDIDLLGRISNSPESIRKAMHTIIHTKPGIQDGVTFSDDLRIEEITKDALYVGIRVAFQAQVAGEKIAMKIDLGFSDEIFPAPLHLTYPCAMPDMPAAELLCYSIESVIAEKWQAMSKLKVMNSRMKDFYDLWFLMREYRMDFQTLQETIRRTFERRGTEWQEYRDLKSEDFLLKKQAEWATYIRKMKADTYHRKPPIELPPRDLGEVMSCILSCLEPVMEEDMQATWKVGKGWVAAK